MVVPLPFQVKLELVCTAMPPVMVLPAAFVVIKLLPPGAVGVCSMPVTVRTPFNVNVDADKVMLAAEMVPLALEFMVPLVTVMVLVTVRAAFTVKVDAVVFPMVSDEQLAAAVIVGWLPINKFTPI